MVAIVDDYGDKRLWQVCMGACLALGNPGIDLTEALKIVLEYTLVSAVSSPHGEGCRCPNEVMQSATGATKHPECAKLFYATSM